MLLQAVARTRPKLVEVPTRLGHADHRHVKVAAFHHGLQRGKDLLVSQIAGGAKKHQGVGVGFAHGNLHSLLGSGLLQVPAEPVAHGGEQPVLIIRFAARGEALVERGGKNRYRHGLVDGGLDGPPALAGIRYAPGELGQTGSFTKAAAVRSSSHDAITLPRRHTSAMSRRLKSYW